MSWNAAEERTLILFKNFWRVGVKTVPVDYGKDDISIFLILFKIILLKFERK